MSIPFEDRSRVDTRQRIEAVDNIIVGALVPNNAAEFRKGAEPGRGAPKALEQQSFPPQNVGGQGDGIEKGIKDALPHNGPVLPPVPQGATGESVRGRQ